MNAVEETPLPAKMEPDQETVKDGFIEIRIKGKGTKVPAALISGRVVITSGKWLKMAKLRDEELIAGERVANPESFVDQLKKENLKADIFSFAQSLPDTVPQHRNYRTEWDNLAVIPITTYKEWYSGLSEAVKRAIKKAKKTNVVVKEVEFSDEFVREIQGVYNESPIRQGRIFWHYQKDFELVKAENSTYPDRNIFIGAYLGEELIGFIRIIRAGKSAEIIQILSMQCHQDKRPTNALIAKAVEICEQKGLSHLVYCNYIYKDPNSSLTEFKRRNRFEQVLLPRYYVPLTLKGKVALALQLHHGVKGFIPTPIVGFLLQARAWFTESIVAPMRGFKTQGGTEVQS